MVTVRFRSLLHSNRRFATLLAAGFLAIALLTKTTPESAHEFSRLGTVESLVERGTFALDDSTFVDTIDKIRRDGHFYSHQPPLLALIETPVYAALRITGMRFNNSGRLVMTYLFSLFTSGLALALTMVVLSRVFMLTGVDRHHAEMFGVLLPLATWLLPYGLVANNHIVAGLLLAASLLLMLYIEAGERTARVFFALGVVLGLLVAVEIVPVVSFVPLTFVFLVRMRNVTSRLWLACCAGLLLPLAAHTAANVRVTGDIIPAGFHHELFAYDGSSFDERTLTGTLKHDSVDDAAGYAWTSLFAAKGFFTFAPILMLAVIAGAIEWRWWNRARAVRQLILGGIVLSLGAAVLTTNNYGGEAVGFRHATYLSPAMLILLAPWIANRLPWQRTTVVVVATLSMVSMLLFAAARPWSVLTLGNAIVRPMADYVPLITHLARRDLLKP